MKTTVGVEGIFFRIVKIRVFVNSGPRGGEGHKAKVRHREDCVPSGGRVVVGGPEEAAEALEEEEKEAEASRFDDHFDAGPGDAGFVDHHRDALANDARPMAPRRGEAVQPALAAGPGPRP